MTELWNPDQSTPAFQVRAIQSTRLVEAVTVALEGLVALSGLLVLSASLLLLLSVFITQVNPNDFDINASGFWRP